MAKKHRFWFFEDRKNFPCPQYFAQSQNLTTFVVCATKAQIFIVKV